MFPTHALVTVRLPGPHGENSIEEQYPLLCPFGQLAMIGYGQPKFIMDLFEYIFKRGRWRYTLSHRKTKPMGLALSVIRVLSNNHNLYITVRCKLQCIKNIIHIGVNPASLIFFCQECTKFQIIFLFKFPLQQFIPFVTYIYHKYLHKGGEYPPPLSLIL